MDKPWNDSGVEPDLTKSFYRSESLTLYDLNASCCEYSLNFKVHIKDSLCAGNPSIRIFHTMKTAVSAFKFKIIIR